MSNPLPLTIDFGTLPNTGQGYPPQAFADRLGINGRIFTEQAFALFTTGATAPTSDSGPWAANGNTWYYWNSETGSYVPFLIPQASLKYFVGSETPDPDVYLFWIELDANGSPVAVKTYYNGAWTDVYSASLGSYLTVADFNTAIAAYSTTIQMTAAIAAALVPYSTTTAMNSAIAAGDSATLSSAHSYTDSAVASASAYPAQGVVGVPQTIAIDTTPHKVAFNTAPINPAPAPFNAALYRYVAPVAGIYNVSCSTQFDNLTGTASGMQVLVELWKNGVFVGYSMDDIDNTPSPTGDRWSPSFSGLVSLAANDYLEIFASMNDTVNTGNISLTVAQLSVHRVSA